MITQLTRILVTGILATALVACTTPAAPAGGSTPPVDEAGATAIAQNALDGYNSGEYEVWARDWSDTMRSVIRDADFQAARSQLMANTGRFLAIEGVAYQETKPGIHRYTFTVAFEKMTTPFWISFIGDSPKVEGVKFE